MSGLPQQYVDAHRKQVRDLVVLARLSPRNPVTLAETDVYVASAACSTPPGSTSGEPARYWMPLLLDASSISSPGEFADTDLALSTTTLTIARSACDPAQYLLEGARATVWLWHTSATDFDHAGCMLANARVLAVDNDAHTITLTLRQRTDWNRDLAPTEVTPDAYPHAPEDSIGQRLPIVYGRVSDVPFRNPWPEFPSVQRTAATTDTVYLPLLLGGRRAGPAVLVDTGRGAGAVTNPKARVVVAGHKCKTVVDAASGCGVYVKQGDKLATLEPVDLVNDVFNTSSEAGMLLPDNAALAWVSALASDVDVVANSAENPRAILDPFNDANWARLDWTAGNKTLRAKLPSLDNTLGEATEVYAFIGYRSVANTNLKLRFRNTATGVTFDIALPASATRRVLMARVTTGWVSPAPTTPWDTSVVELEAGWPTSSPAITGTGTAEVYFCGLAVRYKQRQSTIESERYFDHTGTRPVTRRTKGGGEHTVWMPYTERETLPATMELLGDFYANVEGYADDGEFAAAGTFTGTSNALIQRPCDVLAHMLVRYGGESLANIERGVGTFGSFVDARALLRDQCNRDMVAAFSVAQSVDVMTAITWLAQAGVARPLLDRFTDTWRLLPWRTDLGVDYDWTFRPQDIVEGTSVVCTRTPANRLLTGLSLGYGYDAVTRQYKHKTRLAWNGSNGGFKYRGIRDEYLTVVAGVNDRLDFTTTAARNATLTAGSYDGPGYAAMVGAAMKAADPAQEFVAVHGCTIVAGYNDQLYYRDHLAFGGVGADRTVTIAEGTRASFDVLCADIAAAMNAVNEGYATELLYMRTQRLVRFARPGAGSLTLYLGSGGLRSQRLYATLGFNTTGTVAMGGELFGIGTLQRQEETLVLGCIGNALDLNWETGLNGLKGSKRNCASLCGFQTLRDSLGGGSQRSWLADSPKGMREAALVATQQRYGARRDTVEDLRAVADTDTAREVRNRVAALVGRSRLTITFSTDMAPDLERGRVVQLSSDFDAVQTYPDADSDGTWAGKRFVVVETEQMLGPAAFYTKVRAVALD